MKNKFNHETALQLDQQDPLQEFRSLFVITARGREVDYSKGIAITSIFSADEVTRVEPVRYSEGHHSSVP